MLPDAETEHQGPLGLEKSSEDKCRKAQPRAATGMEENPCSCDYQELQMYCVPYSIPKSDITNYGTLS